MKQKTVKVFLLILCICATVFGSAFCVHAEQLKEVITSQQDISLPTADSSAGYVYLNAEVPKGWGGEIQVIFHSGATGKDHTCTMSYLENEYHSGLWLPAESYKVTSKLTVEDGLCRLQLKDSAQETIRVQKGKDLYLTVLAVETSEDAPAPTGTAPVVPPKPQDAYQDLPTAASDTTEETEVTKEVTPEEAPDKHSTQGRVVQILAILLVIVVAILTIAYFLQEHRNQDDF